MHTLSLKSKNVGDSLMSTGITLGVTTGAMIASQKFLDLRAIATQMNITIDSGSAIDTVLTHQGAIKVVAAGFAMYALRKTKIGRNEFFKLALLGVMIQGTLQEVNVQTGGVDYQIGDANLNKAMQEAAEEINKTLQGNGNQKFIGNGDYTLLNEGMGITNPTNEFTPGVGTTNPTNEFTPGVGYANENGTGVGYPDLLFND